MRSTWRHASGRAPTSHVCPWIPAPSNVERSSSTSPTCPPEPIVHPPSARDLAIEHALRDRADRLGRSGDGGWRLVIAGGARAVLHARIVDDDWLVVDLYRAWSARSWWPLLQLNAGLDGCVRL